MSIFWTMSILLYSTAAYTAAPPDQSSPLPRSNNDLHPRGDIYPFKIPRQCCTFIADIVEVFFQPGSGIFSAQAVPFPVGTALKYLMTTEGYGSEDSKKLVGYLSRKGFSACVANFVMGSRREWLDMSNKDQA
jgi:hypothetical protein